MSDEDGLKPLTEEELAGYDELFYFVGGQWGDNPPEKVAGRRLIAEVRAWRAGAGPIAAFVSDTLAHIGDPPTVAIVETPRGVPLRFADLRRLRDLMPPA